MKAILDRKGQVVRNKVGRRTVQYSIDGRKRTPGYCFGGFGCLWSNRRT